MLESCEGRVQPSHLLPAPPVHHHPLHPLLAGGGQPGSLHDGNQTYEMISLLFCFEIVTRPLSATFQYVTLLYIWNLGHYTPFICYFEICGAVPLSATFIICCFEIYDNFSWSAAALKCMTLSLYLLLWIYKTLPWKYVRLTLYLLLWSACHSSLICCFEICDTCAFLNLWHSPLICSF